MSVKKLQKKQKKQAGLSEQAEVIPYRQRDMWQDPFQNLTNLQREMTRVFNQPLFGFPSFRFPGFELPTKELQALGNLGKIAVDVKDLKDKIEVKIDLPGLARNDFEVSIQDGNLVIKGEKKEEKETKEKDFYRKERSYGSFYRSIELPCGVDESKIAATYKNGVLQLILPKSKEAKPKAIKINVEG